jgi:hypothetical protein
MKNMDGGDCRGVFPLHQHPPMCLVHSEQRDFTEEDNEDKLKTRAFEISGRIVSFLWNKQPFPLFFSLLLCFSLSSPVYLFVSIFVLFDSIFFLFCFFGKWVCVSSVDN